MGNQRKQLDNFSADRSAKEQLIEALEKRET